MLVQEVRCLEAGRQPSDDGKAHLLTGTLTCMALSVLEGRPHTVSSELEAVGYSLMTIAAGGQLADAFGFTCQSTSQMCIARRGMMMGRRDDVLHGVPERLHGFVRSIRDLFFPREGAQGERVYKENVTVAQFEAVCRAHGAQ